MAKEDKERVIKVVSMFSEECNSFSRDDIEQLTEYKMAGERLYAREEGHKEGHAEGRAEGVIEGFAEGIKQNRYEIVTNMLKENYDIEEIRKITGLNEEEIIKIKETL